MLFSDNNIQCNSFAEQWSSGKLSYGEGGFIRSIANIESKGLKIETVVSDRHLQIQKHVRENMPNTTHNYDIWHVAKKYVLN